jgi:hypothetical protein
MTKGQQFGFYLPAWKRAWARIRSLSAVPNPVALPDALLNQVLDLVVVSRHAGRENAVRHACHIVALGRDPSSKTLTSAEIDRVVCLFRILADPDDLRAIDTWSHPSDVDRRRLLWAVWHTGWGARYIHKVAWDKFRQQDPNLLTDQHLHDLVRTLKARWRSRLENLKKFPPRGRAPEGEPGTASDITAPQEPEAASAAPAGRAQE